MLTTLNHITITTGHNRVSPRHEVDDYSLDVLKSWIDSVPTGTPVALPGDFDGARATITIDGGALMCTIWIGDTPAVTFGCVKDAKDGQKVWDNLLTLSGHTQTQKPAEPYCAVVLRSVFAIVNWLGDIERCIAWAWIALLEEKESKKEKPDMFVFQNRGEELTETNYWQSEHAAKGLVYVSGNAGALRMLIPPASEDFLKEMKKVKRVTIERSILRPGKCLDFVFDDGSDLPFCIAVDKTQIDRKIKHNDRWKLLIYTKTGLKKEFATLAKNIDD